MSLEAPPPASKKGPTKLIVPLVIVLGLLLGVAFTYLIPFPSPSPFGPPVYFWNQLRNLLFWDMMLSTVSISLLVALTAVYVRMYLLTRARFVLGILVVVLTLLFQALFRYPLLIALTGTIPIRGGLYFSSADLLSIAAYAVFLYLSLE